MFQFIGYDFYSDGNALNNAPSAVSNIIDTKLTNGIFDHLNLTKNTNIIKINFICTIIFIIIKFTFITIRFRVIFYIFKII